METTFTNEGRYGRQKLEELVMEEDALQFRMIEWFSI